MVSIAIRFLSGRYHATGWDHHVNEGVPEWPPAPFRILRALTAASYRIDPSPVQAEVIALLQLLSSDPEYTLPPVTQGHVRYFMPTADKKTKIFDSFVAVGDGAGANSGEIVVSWPDVDISAEQAKLLARLLEALGYLGRAESWVECRLLPEHASAANARPLGEDHRAEHETRLLACESPAGYESWRRGFLAASPTAKFKPPESLWEILHTDTGQLHAQGWSSPPGTRWVRYGFERAPFREVVGTPRQASIQAKPTIARYALHGSVLPRIAEAVMIGDRMRQALMAHSRDEAGISHGVFSGRDDAGVPMKGQQHAFFLPEDADGDGFIDHVLVWARNGFDSRAERALRSIERLWGSSGHELWLVLANLGEPSDCGTTRRVALRGATATLGSAVDWRSATPFVPTRNMKYRGGRWVDTPEEQLRRALSQLGFVAQAVTPVQNLRVGGSSLAWHRFRRERLSGSGSRGNGQGFGFDITFAEPVAGPVVAGYGAHFGLGRFEAQ